MAFATEAAMRTYVEGQGSVFFLGDAQELSDEYQGTLLMRQRLVEFHDIVAVPKTFDFYKAVNGNCWFKDQPYSRSAMRIRPNYPAET